MTDELPSPPQSPWRQITQPFIDLIHAPRALWGINLPYLIEGMCYFGMIIYMTKYFVGYVFEGQEVAPDVPAGWMTGMLTAGITFAMFFLGTFADRWGVRRAILIAFFLMIIGRICLSFAPSLQKTPQGWGSPTHIMAMMGILIVVIGYGLYQPAAYAAVKQFTTPKTAAMGFAMLYALMNLGGWLPTFVSPIRNHYGISGAFWFYSALTAASFLITWIILSRRTVEVATQQTKAELVDTNLLTKALEGEISQEVKPLAIPALNWMEKLVYWIEHHPLTDAKFTFFIFCLIPVQTLFAYNWLVLPDYVERAYAYNWPWISKNFESATNINSLLIFILVPIVTALTTHKKVYSMMIVGTLIMACPSFLLTLGATPAMLVGYLVIMTVGEAMWQPRFLQYAAEIAPPGRTGEYMGVAQLPWFLTKMLVPIYSGYFLTWWCPPPVTISYYEPLRGFEEMKFYLPSSMLHTEQLWLVTGLIALSSPALLLLARNWAGKDFKTKAD
ncbi:MAG: hypothetical protein HJJLKODD_00238 [Phycisphaerae bacterium]|nr:hypothetical protein [Phycisphaerae bacterium]